jgi:glutaredoxin
MKKFIQLMVFSVLILSLFLATPANNVLAQENSSVSIQLFYGEGCPHCEKANIFLESLEEKYNSNQAVVIYETFEVYNNQENQEKMLETANSLGAEVKGVPFIVVGNTYFMGYGSDESTGLEITKVVTSFLEKSSDTEVEQIDDSKTISLPIIGTISPKSVSLPFFTILVALIDGFNPCAMWTLVFLISLLVGMKNKKRMWTLGILFIATSALVYFVFLATWFNFFIYFGYIKWIKVIIGLVAIIAGGYYIKEAITNKTGACKVTSNKKRSLYFEKLKSLTLQKSLFFASIGIILLAIAVNIVELACSAGLPAIYTKILSMSNLPSWQYYLYLILYIIIFMIDDLIIFFVAMVTLKVIAVDGKYTKISHWVGGILLLIVGLLLLIKPELLMIG